MTYYYCCQCFPRNIDVHQSHMQFRIRNWQISLIFQHFEFSAGCRKTEFHRKCYKQLIWLNIRLHWYNVPRDHHILHSSSCSICISRLSISQLDLQSTYGSIFSQVFFKCGVCEKDRSNPYTKTVKVMNIRKVMGPNPQVKLRNK